MLAVLDRFDYWQAAYIIAKGHYQEVRAAGLEALRRSIVEIEPGFAKHVEHLTYWQQFSLLSVEASRCPGWYKPGLLLIGDAAHVMSPVGGLGINYAIQDSVVAANVLAAPLESGRVRLSELAKVQRQREWPTRFIQGVQSIVQKRIVSGALRSREATKVPWYVRFFLRVPVLRDLPARVIALGVWRVHVRDAKNLNA